MFGSGTPGKVAALAALLLLGGQAPAFGADSGAWFSLCEAQALSWRAPSPMPLMPPYTVASLPRPSGEIQGCFSSWLPLQVEARLITVSPTPNLSASLGGGSLAQLQTRWDLGEFDFSQNKPVEFRFGNVANLEAEREAIVAFLEKVANNLLPSSQPGGDPVGDVGFTLNLEQIYLSPQTLLQGSGVFSVDENLNLFLEDLTITLSNGTITTETQLNPQDLSFERSAFSINLSIGNATVSSTTTFEKDQGVTKQVLSLTAGLGQLQLHSQVTLAINSSEFRLGASISDLAITTISAIDASGHSSQTFELELNF